MTLKSLNIYAVMNKICPSIKEAQQNGADQ